MPKAVTPLTQTQIKNAKPKEKDYNLSDGFGLQLRVRSNGTKHWNYQYSHPFTKKRVNIGLGTLDKLSLKRARELAQKYREQIAQGIDPKDAREQELLSTQALYQNTFYTIAKRWIDIKRDSVTPAHAKDLWRSLELHVFPALGNTPISAIKTPNVIKVLRPIEAKGSLETVKRLTQRMNEIMTYPSTVV